MESFQRVGRLEGRKNSTQPGTLQHAQMQPAHAMHAPQAQAQQQQLGALGGVFHAEHAAGAQQVRGWGVDDDLSALQAMGGGLPTDELGAPLRTEPHIALSSTS